MDVCLWMVSDGVGWSCEFVVVSQEVWINLYKVQYTLAVLHLVPCTPDAHTLVSGCIRLVCGCIRLMCRCMWVTLQAHTHQSVQTPCGHLSLALRKEKHT